MRKTNALDGFVPGSFGSDGEFTMPTACKSRSLLEAFLDSGEEFQIAEISSPIMAQILR